MHDFILFKYAIIIEQCATVRRGMVALLQRQPAKRGPTVHLQIPSTSQIELFLAPPPPHRSLAQQMYVWLLSLEEVVMHNSILHLPVMLCRVKCLFQVSCCSGTVRGGKEGGKTEDVLKLLPSSSPSPSPRPVPHSPLLSRPLGY